MEGEWRESGGSVERAWRESAGGEEGERRGEEGERGVTGKDRVTLEGLDGF